MNLILKPQAYAYDLVLLGITPDQYKACKWYGQMTEDYNAQVLMEMDRLSRTPIATLRALNVANDRMRRARTDKAMAEAIAAHAVALANHANAIAKQEKAA